MRKATQAFIETALRSDDTCDNACIGPAIDAAKGKRGQHFTLDEIDRVMSRKDVAERLNVSERCVSYLASRGEIRRILSRKRRGKVIGYSAKSVAEFLERMRT